MQTLSRLKKVDKSDSYILFISHAALFFFNYLHNKDIKSFFKKRTDTCYYSHTIYLEQHL